MDGYLIISCLFSFCQFSLSRVLYVVDCAESPYKCKVKSADGQLPRTCCVHRVLFQFL